MITNETLEQFKNKNWHFYKTDTYWIFLDENNQPFVVNDNLGKKVIERINRVEKNIGIREIIKLEKLRS